MIRLRTITILTLLLLGSVPTIYGAEKKDPCQADLQQLRAAEAEQCNGLNYLVNPSACFNTRKALAPFNSGRCGQLAAPPAAPAVPTAPSPASAAPAAVAPAVQPPAVPPAPVASRPANPAPVSGEADLDRLRRELADLKAELQRFKEEISVLKSRQQ